MKRVRNFRDDVFSDYNRYGVKAPFKSIKALIWTSIASVIILIFLGFLIIGGNGNLNEIDQVRTGELVDYPGESIASIFEKSPLIQDYSWNSSPDENGASIVEFHGEMGLVGYFESLLESEGKNINLKGSRFEVFIRFTIKDSSFEIIYTGLEIAIKGEGGLVNVINEPLNQVDVLTTLHDGDGSMLWIIMQMLM